MSIGLNNLTSFHNIPVFQLFENKNDHTNDANYVTLCHKSVTKLTYGYRENPDPNKKIVGLNKNQRGNFESLTAVNHGEIYLNHDKLFYLVSYGVNRQAIEQRRFPLE